MKSQPPKTSLLFMTLLPFFSGAAALSHELLWTRRLIDVLGATDWVVGRVLGLFFLGLSLGGFLATLLSKNQRQAIVQLVIAEALVAVLALPAAFLPFWTDWIWSSLGPASLLDWQGSLVKLLIAGVVVLPPAIAMGCTLPFFVRVATGIGRGLDSSGVWIYSVNTIGGVFGLWVTSTVILEWLGAQQTMFVVAAINGLIALVAWSAFRLAPSHFSDCNNRDKKATVEKVISTAATNEATGKLWSLLGLSFLSGFIVLSFEILLLRLIALVVPSSYHTTSALLANVILILGFSSLAISLLNSVKPESNLAKAKWLMLSGFAASTILISLCPAILFEASDKLMSIRYYQGLNGRIIESVNHFWFLVFCLVGMTSGLALMFCGFIFPSLITLSSDSDASGKRIGLLLAANGIGGIAGSELFNSWIIEWVGIYQGFSVLAVFTLIAGVVLLFATHRWLSISVGVVLSVVVFLGQRYNHDLPYYSPRATTQFDVKRTIFGPEGVLLVVEAPNQSRSIFVNNQYILGSSGVAQDQRRQLLLPWLLHSEAKSVCCLGLATGISASGLELVGKPPTVTAVELSANVAEIAREYFDDETLGFFDRAGNQVIIEDARIYMAAVNNKYDLIVGDLYRPHGVGEARLFTQSHFRNVRRALTDDGLFCQWLPIYQLNEENFLTIAATFQSVFPDTLIVYGNRNARYPVLGLLGRKSELPWTKQAKLVTSVSPELQELDPLLSRVSNLVVGRLKKDALNGHELNTLDNLAVEISAGNFWILKDLRRNRPDSYQKEFLSGQHLIEFNQRLKALTDPISQ